MTAMMLGMTVLENGLDLKVSTEQFAVNKRLSDTNDITTEQIYFYKVLRTRDEYRFDYEETGMGQFKTIDGDTVFQRLALFTFKKPGKNIRRSVNSTPKKLEKDYKYIWCHHIPESLPDLFFSEDSVLCSTDPHEPVSVRLQNNTLLGKLEDHIQSIDRSELWSILLKGYKKPERPVTGAIRFNKQKGMFEGYNGKRWRTLMWGDDESTK